MPNIHKYKRKIQTTKNMQKNTKQKVKYIRIYKFKKNVILCSIHRNQ